MKKLTPAVLAALLTALIPAIACGVSINNSAVMLDEGDVYMGVEAYRVNQREVEEVHDRSEALLSTDLYLLAISYAALDTLAFDLRFGTSNLEVDDAAFDFDFGYGVSWGASVHKQLVDVEKHDLKAGLSLHYLDYGAKNERAKLADEFDIKPEGTEWILSAEVTKGFGNFILHGGARYSDLEIRIKDFVSEDEPEEDPEIKTDLKFEQQNEFALMLGGEVRITEEFRVLGEIQFLDGETMALRALYSY